MKYANEHPLRWWLRSDEARVLQYVNLKERFVDYINTHPRPRPKTKLEKLSGKRFPMHRSAPSYVCPLYVVVAQSHFHDVQCSRVAGFAAKPGNWTSPPRPPASPPLLPLVFSFSVSFSRARSSAQHRYLELHQERVFAKIVHVSVPTWLTVGCLTTPLIRAILQVGYGLFPYNR